MVPLSHPHLMRDISLSQTHAHSMRCLHYMRCDDRMCIAIFFLFSVCPSPLPCHLKLVLLCSFQGDAVALTSSTQLFVRRVRGGRQAHVAQPSPGAKRLQSCHWLRATIPAAGSARIPYVACGAAVPLAWLLCGTKSHDCRANDADADACASWLLGSARDGRPGPCRSA
jgi:hypothetical protein